LRDIGWLLVVSGCYSQQLFLLHLSSKFTKRLSLSAFISPTVVHLEFIKNAFLKSIASSVLQLVTSDEQSPFTAEQLGVMETAVGNLEGR